MTWLIAFVRLARPLFLGGGFVGVALGAAVARHGGAQLDAATYVCVQLMVSAYQLMVHFANDYFDRAGDARASAPRTRWSGGSGALVDETARISPRAALIAALACAAIGLALTAYAALVGNVAVAATGAAILVLSWCYSAPPARLAARGLGEFDATLVVAVLVPFAGYAAFTSRIDGPVVTAVIAPAAALFAMMLCVELPDAGTDTLTGKRNLVVRWGPARTWMIVAGLAVAAASLAVVLALRLHAGSLTIALAPATGAAGALYRRITRDPHPASLALLGVALYALTAAGLALVYAVVPPR